MADQRKRLIAEVRAVVDGAKEVERLTQGLEGVENQARRDYRDPTQKVQRGMRNTQRESRETANVIGDLRGTFATLAGVLGAGALGGKLLRTANEMEAVNRQSESLGMSVQRMSELSFTFRQYQLQQDDVSDALGTLSDRAEDASSGMQSFIEDFQLLNVEVEDLRGKTPGELFELVADRVSQIEDPMKRTAGVVRIFGDDLGRRLLPLLIKGSEELERNAEKAREVGAAYDKEAAEAGAEAARTFRELRETIDAQFTREVAEHAGSLETLAEALIQVATWGGDAASAIDTLAKSVAAAATDDYTQDLDVLENRITGLRKAIGNTEGSDLEQGWREFWGFDTLKDMREELDRLEAKRDGIRARMLRGDAARDIENRPGAFGTFGPGGSGDGEEGGSADGGGSDDATEERTEKLRELIEAQREEARTVGMSAEELTIYRARQLGATEADIQAIREAYDVQQAREAQIQADKAAAQAAEERAEAQKKAREQDAKTLASLQRELELQRMGEEARFVQQELDQLSPDAPKEMRKEVARLARELHGLRETTEETGEEMSEFAKSAARNMQSEFADFLFDPFDEGLDGLLDGFVRTLRRMAAEAAAAEIFDETFGGDQGFAKFLDSIFNSGGGSSSSSMGAGTGSSPASASGGSSGSGWANLIGTVLSAFQFHEGGVVGAGGAPTRAVPAGTFAGADHFSTGGVAGLGPREVPIIAHENEEILTDKDPRHRDNLGRGKGGGTTIIQNIQTPDAQSFRRSSAAVRQDLKMATREK